MTILQIGFNPARYWEPLDQIPLRIARKSAVRLKGVEMVVNATLILRFVIVIMGIIQSVLLSILVLRARRFLMLVNALCTGERI